MVQHTISLNFRIKIEIFQVFSIGLMKVWPETRQFSSGPKRNFFSRSARRDYLINFLMESSDFLGVHFADETENVRARVDIGVGRTRGESELGGG